MSGQTKLKIDLSRGVIEMEGDETFVEKNLKEVKELLYGMNRRRDASDEVIISDRSDHENETLPLLVGADDFSQNSRVMELTSTDLIAFLNSLNLKNSEMEYVTAFTYFLKEKQKWPIVTIEDLSRCFRLIKRPVPNVLKAVDNAGTRNNWLKRSRKDGILLTREGMNFVEYPELSRGKTAGNGGGQREKAHRSGSSAPPPVRIKGDLDIYGKGEHPSFKDFASAFAHDDNISRIAVSAYYVTEVLQNNSFDTDDIFTIFDVMRWKPPTYLKNNIYNHAKSHGFYTIADDGKFQGTLKLKIYVEHDLGLHK